VIRVNDADDLPDDLAGIVGVTAGASAPEALVTAVVGRLAPRGGIERAPVTLEEEYFPPPPELRELLRGLAGALSLLNRVPSPDPADPADTVTRVLAEDRTTAAADVLERLAG
jgi:4-hydroxy-3-methylbut-2-enyl diphosphate reductase